MLVRLGGKPSSEWLMASPPQYTDAVPAAPEKTLERESQKYKLVQGHVFYLNAQWEKLLL